MEAIAGQSMFGMHKGMQGTTPAVASNRMQKKKETSPLMSAVDLETVNVDLLHCLCGSYY